MKIVNIGEGAVYKLGMQPKAKHNTYGNFGYFDERLMLIKKNPITEYTIIPANGTYSTQVGLNDPELAAELNAICDAINKDSQFKFKKYENKVYLKLGSNCQVPPRDHELLYCVCVYGIFNMASTQTTHLQMEIAEIAHKPIKLLNPSWATAAAPAASNNASWGSTSNNSEETQW